MSAGLEIRTKAGVADGVLIARKEAGWTSHDVVAKVRGLLGGVKVGHAGTLDPAATGVLPLLIGRATRIAEYLVGWEKEYHTVLRLGEVTDTQDATGTVLARVDASGVTSAAVQEVLGRFRGPQKQVPPMYSAIKVGGRPLYKAARAGQTVERAERDIVIHELDFMDMTGRDVTVRVVCSKGTYIRTLCADIGQALGVGGHMAVLERRRVGELSIDEALTVEQIAAQHAIGTLGTHLWTLDRVLGRLPACVVTEQEAVRVLHGAPVRPEGWSGVQGSTPVRLKDSQGKLLAIGFSDSVAHGPITIQKVLVDLGSLN